MFTMRSITFFIFTSALLLAVAVQAKPTQQVLKINQKDPAKARPLTGKFLHITDVHPDPFYKIYSSTDEESTCHRGTGPAGYYGAETSDCDSPLALVDAVFDWLRTNVRDEVDFVIWTGDSARHDNDENIPRNNDAVIDQNRLLVSKFLEAFGKTGDNLGDGDDDDDPTNDFVVPIIPTLGNNDVLPHNIFEPGPNFWTSKYLDVWRGFIPEAQRHQFQRGGWFSVTAIPGKLEVFSLNTLYFFASNSAVDGCIRKDSPGYEQFDWLRIQLQILRDQGKKAIIIGHVPPARTDSKTSWTESCWQKYTLWTHSYRDVIVGSLYGHMNIDHFMLQDWHDVKKHVRNGKQYFDDDDDDDAVAEDAEDNSVDATGNESLEPLDELVGIESVQDYLISLRSSFSKIPKLKSNSKNPSKGAFGREFGERYSVSLVSPSVVPNYFPTLRIFSYNITGLESAHLSSQDAQKKNPKLELRSLHEDDIEAQPISPVELDDVKQNKKKKKHDKNKKKHKKHHKHKKHKKNKPKRKEFKFTVPKQPSKTAAPGPAYSPQPLSFISYTQLYVNLTHANNDYVETDKWNPGKHHGKRPPKKPHPTPRNLTFELEYSTSGDKIYGVVEDLTMPNWIGLAKKIAGANKPKKKKDLVWYEFVKRAFVGTVDGEELEDRFGICID